MQIKIMIKKNDKKPFVLFRVLSKCMFPNICQSSDSAERKGEREKKVPFDADEPKICSLQQ